MWVRLVRRGVRTTPPRPPRSPPPPPGLRLSPKHRKQIIAIIGGGIAAIAIAVHQYKESLSSHSLSSQSLSLPVLVSDTPVTRHRHPVLSYVDRYGLPSLPYTNEEAQYAYPLIVKQSYVATYNHRLRVADWCVETLAPSRDRVSAWDGLGGNDGAKGDRTLSSFHSDSALVSEYRVQPTDFEAPYDRGHLVPAANAKTSQQSMDDTFALTNIVPQHRTLNRQWWRSLEAWVRDLRDHYHRVTVVTGTLSLMEPNSNTVTYQLLPKSAPVVAVPTHLYKLILCERHENDSAPVIATIIVPNKPIPPSLPLDTFLSSLAALESASGWRFFPRIRSQLNDSNERALCLNVDCDLQKYHRKFAEWDRASRAKGNDKHSQQKDALLVVSSNTSKSNTSSTTRGSSAKNGDGAATDESPRSPPVQ